MHPKYSPAYWLSIRIILYGMAFLSICLVIKYDLQNSVQGQKFAEHSITRFSKTTLIIFLSGLFYYLKLRYNHYRQISWSLFYFMLICFLFDKDVYIDDWFYQGSWKVFFGLFLICMIFMWTNQWTNFISCLAEFSKTHVAGILLCTLFTSYVFSPFFGSTTFWMAVMDNHDHKDAQNAVRECLELYGYVFLSIFAFEYAILVRRANQVIIQPYKKTKFNRTFRTENSQPLFDSVTGKMSPLEKQESYWI